MIVYVMVHLPYFWWWKIGFAHYSVFKRMVALDKAVFGFFLPIGIMVIPFAYPVEQWFHRKFRRLHYRFYRGDGSTETYWFPAGIPVLIVMMIVWAAYCLVVGKMLNFDGLEWFYCFNLVIWHYTMIVVLAIVDLIHHFIA